MTTTLTAIANAAADDIGVNDSGEGLSATQLAQALDVANKLLDNWSSEAIQVPFEANATEALTAGNGQYTVGAAQTWNINPAPLRITSAMLLMSNGVNTPVEIIDAAKWDSLVDRSSTSNLIRYLFYALTSGTPLGLAQVSPVPANNGGSLIFQFWKALTQFPDTTTPITLAPGYGLPFEYALAKLLSVKFDVPWSDVNAQNYQEAMIRVRALNAQMWGLTTPAAQ